MWKIKNPDYSISDSPEPDLKTVSIYLHQYYTLYLLVLLSTWLKIPVHVNLTSPHPGAEAVLKLDSISSRFNDLFSVLKMSR
jgi:hypothetical protein